MHSVTTRKSYVFAHRLLSSEMTFQYYTLRAGAAISPIVRVPLVFLAFTEQYAECQT